MSAGMSKLLPFLLPLLAAESFQALPFLAASSVLLPFLLPLLAAGSFQALPFLAARVLFDGNRA